MTRVWDISQCLRPAMPLWPGEPDLALTRNVEIGEASPVNVGSISFPLHAGTHADAPLHYAAQGASSAECDLEPYLGPCRVIDVRSAAALVRDEHIAWDEIEGETRVLFRTYARFPHAEWDADFTAIAPGVIARLREMGVRLVGTDAPSLDPQESKEMAAHHEILKGDMRILEGLVLEDVPAGRYELIALPLKILGADASPTRAILRELQ